MSELPHDDMERDSKLTAMYRAAAQDAPPAALDAAILAAARREAGARPRPAGFAFGHSWRMPLSIAAVIVLSVSLVTVMREEAPELTEPPRAGQPAAGLERKPAASADSGAVTTPGFVPDEQRSKSIGLKPPLPMSSPGLAMRQPGSAERGALLPRRDMMADRLEADAPASADLAKRRDAPANVTEQHSDKRAAAPPPRQAAALSAPKDNIAQPSAAASAASGVVENKPQVRSQAANIDRADRDSRFRAAPEPAPVAEKQSAEAAPAPNVEARPAAKAKSASPAVSAIGKLERLAELPPEKWLERIEELRRQGKFDEAKASLVEFRKRFPDYRLPDALRDWGNP